VQNNSVRNQKKLIYFTHTDTRTTDAAFLAPTTKTNWNGHNMLSSEITKPPF
jgi:hypothetical protein